MPGLGKITEFRYRFSIDMKTLDKVLIIVGGFYDKRNVFSIVYSRGLHSDGVAAGDSMVYGR